MAFTHEDTGGGTAEPVSRAGDKDTGHEIILPPGGVLAPIAVLCDGRGLGARDPS
jgi:hypothetical protein